MDPVVRPFEELLVTAPAENVTRLYTVNAPVNPAPIVTPLFTLVSEPKSTFMVADAVPPMAQLPAASLLAWTSTPPTVNKVRLLESDTGIAVDPLLL
ncbi:MAG: hypothetical protein CMK54_02775 [Proteobacteria bacterium]|nr:hypothetical protein [Pseudomonadota bacterium]